MRTYRSHIENRHVDDVIRRLKDGELSFLLTLDGEVTASGANRIASAIRTNSERALKLKVSVRNGDPSGEGVLHVSVIGKVEDPVEEAGIKSGDVVEVLRVLSDGRVLLDMGGGVLFVASPVTI